MEYGIPHRWPLAALLALVTWLLFPLAPALAFSRLLHERQSLEPAQRLRLYDSRQRYARIAALIAVYFTVTVIHPERIRYLGLAWFGILRGTQLLFPYWFWWGALSGLVRRRLSRDVVQGGFTFLGNPLWEFGTALFMVLLVAAPQLLVQQAGAGAALRGLPYVTGAILVGVGLLSLVVFLPAVVRRRPKLPSTPLPEVPCDPERLPGVLAELTERAISERAKTEQDPAQSAQLEKLVRADPMIRAALDLDPDQQAAVTAAMQLCRPQIERRIRLQVGSFFLGMLLTVGVGIGMWLHPVPGMAGAVLPLVLSMIPIGVVPLALRWLEYRDGLRQTEADLQVAQAMEDPRRFLAALEKLEEASSRMTAAMGVSNGLEAGYRKRRRRLEQALCLD